MPKYDEQIVGEACRIEFDQNSGKLYLVFEITDEQYKNKIKKDWTKDIEFKIIDRNLILEE